VCTANGFIAFEDTTVVPSLVRAAYGTVLELGPGPGNQLHRFNVAAVDFIYGVEPSPHYAPNIAAKLQKLHLQNKYKLLTCGIEDSDVLRREEIEEGGLDAVLSIQVLCAVRDVKMVMREVYKLLKPGGCFIFWEHERSRDFVTGAVQGAHAHSPSHEYVERTTYSEEANIAQQLVGTRLGAHSWVVI
jgi:SAM-dependent methyltransferase